jgi:hypothetical protein
MSVAALTGVGDDVGAIVGVTVGVGRGEAVGGVAARSLGDGAPATWPGAPPQATNAAATASERKRLTTVQG